MPRVKMKYAVILLMILIYSFSFNSFALDKDGKWDCISDIESMPIGMMEGSTYAEIGFENGTLSPDIDIDYYNTELDAAIAVRDGKAGSSLSADINCQEILINYPEIMCFPDTVGSTDYAFGFQKGNPLREEFNEAMAELKTEGIDEMLEEKWLSNDESKMVPMKQDWVGEKGTLNFWVNVGSKPMAYVIEGGEIVGYTIDYVYMVCQRMGYNVNVVECNFSGLIPALVSGNADFAGRSMSITEERKKSIDFSDPFVTSDIVLLVRKDNVSDSLKSASDLEVVPEEELSFFQSIKNSFINTFVVEDRWKLFAEGIGTTMLITLASAIVGTMLGLLLYIIFRMDKKWINTIILTLNKWLSGIPVVVILMVMFYIVFKSGSVDGVGVSIITFTILFGISVFGLIQTGINAIGNQQVEAATDLGFTSNQTFFQILLPQAVNYVMPLYRSKVVEHLKATAIVGYIAIQDLTKMSDLVRSRTFEAFFPLIVTAILYYILGHIIDMLLERFEKKMKPGNHKSSLLKGVTLR